MCFLLNKKKEFCFYKKKKKDKKQRVVKVGWVIGGMKLKEDAMMDVSVPN